MPANMYQTQELYIQIRIVVQIAQFVRPSGLASNNREKFKAQVNMVLTCAFFYSSVYYIY